MSVRKFIRRVINRKNRKAILATANFLEENPDNYRFMETNIPKTEKDCGCALGWIGYFLGLEGDIRNVIEQLNYENGSRFYMDLDEYEVNWHESSESVVYVLREYVKEYY